MNPAAPRPESSFERNAALNERTRQLVLRVEQLAERLLGAIPMPSTGSGGASLAPGKSPVFEALDDDTRRTRADVESALNAVARIEEALP